MNKKQELTISYSEKIASLFSDIDVYAGDISDSMKEGEVTADELCDFYQIAADDADCMISSSDPNLEFDFVKNNLKFCIDAYNENSYEHDSKNCIEIDDLAYWGKKQQEENYIASMMPKAQKLLDEYWAKVNELEEE